MDFLFIALAFTILLVAVPLILVTITLFGLLSLFKRNADVDQNAYLPEIFKNDKNSCQVCGDSSEWCDSC
jgi:uncharacterized BrkB/YihY/UPF0761 family membrane protein